MPTEKKTPPPRLYRSETDRVLGGVAGGLGEYFNIDPIVVRIIFIILFLQGVGFILYLILWLVIPSQSSGEKPSKETIRNNADEIKTKAQSLVQDIRSESQRKKSKTWLGIALIALGVYLLLEKFGIIPFIHLSRLWPVLLVILGIAVLNKNAKHE